LGSIFFWAQIVCVSVSVIIDRIPPSYTDPLLLNCSVADVGAPAEVGGLYVSFIAAAADLFTKSAFLEWLHLPLSQLVSRLKCNENERERRLNKEDFEQSGRL